MVGGNVGIKVGAGAIQHGQLSPRLGQHNEFPKQLCGGAGHPFAEQDKRFLPNERNERALRTEFEEEEEDDEGKLAPPLANSVATIKICEAAIISKKKRAEGESNVYSSTLERREESKDDDRTMDDEK